LLNFPRRFHPRDRYSSTIKPVSPSTIISGPNCIELVANNQGSGCGRLFLQIATEFATIGSMFSPEQPVPRGEKVSSQLCDGSIEAEHGTPSTISSTARSTKMLSRPPELQ